jgi:hypothetical protein
MRAFWINRRGCVRVLMVLALVALCLGGVMASAHWRHFRVHKHRHHHPHHPSQAGMTVPHPWPYVEGGGAIGPLPPSAAPPAVEAPGAPAAPPAPVEGGGTGAPEPPRVEEAPPVEEQPAAEEPAPAEEPAQEETPVEEAPEPPPTSEPEPEPEPPAEVPEAEEPSERPEIPAGELPEGSPESGGDIFSGITIDDFDLEQAAPGAITEVPDPLDPNRTVLQMTVDDTDVYPITPTGDPRAQLLSPKIFESGDEFWWNSEFLLPSDFPSSVPGWVTLLEGPYGEPFDGTPPWHIEANGEHLQWSRNGTYGWDVPWQMPLVRGRWVHVLVHQRFAPDGWVEMWIDGEPIAFFGGNTYNPAHEGATTRLQMQTLDSSNEGGPNFAVIQSYRKKGMFDTLTIYQGPMRLGETRASVGG